MSDAKIEVIQRMYEAFGRGDVEAILAELDDDVDWVAGSEATDPSVPWYGSYQTKGEVPRFFKEIGSHIDVTEFTPLSSTSNETDVMVAVRWAHTVRATGKSASVHMQHWFRFADDKITFVRTLEDTDQSATTLS